MVSAIIQLVVGAILFLQSHNEPTIAVGHDQPAYKPPMHSVLIKRAGE